MNIFKIQDLPSKSHFILGGLEFSINHIFGKSKMVYCSLINPNQKDDGNIYVFPFNLSVELKIK